MSHRAKNEWKLDRHVPVAVIIMLLLQIAAALVWSAQLDARVNNLEQGASGNSGLSERFVRLEERLDNLKDSLGTVKKQLDKLTDHLLKQ